MNENIKQEVLAKANSVSEAFERLYKTVACLRAKDGCPWDREQTPSSMRGDLIEETFEAVDAITQNDSLHACEELGDVFLNATMISYMYEQNKDFLVQDSLNEVCDKIIRRHPHVFPESEGKVNANEKKASTSEEVLSQWDNIKRGIEGRSEESVLDEVSKGLPPLMRSYKMQKKAAKKGFDWNEVNPVWDKVYEEIDELKQASLDKENTDYIEEEAGDLLFAVVNVLRHLKVNPEIALSRANTKFRNRFSYVEKKMNENNEPMEKGKLEIMDKYWDEAKQKELK